MSRYLLSCIVLLIFYGWSVAQVTIHGTITHEFTGVALEGVIISSSIPDESTTDADGRFSIEVPAIAPIVLVLDYQGVIFEFRHPNVATNDMQLGEIQFRGIREEESDVELPILSLEELEQEQESNISSLLQSGEDLFGSITSYTFSPSRFRRRGLEGEYTEAYLNYLPVNDLEGGGVYFSQWGGLNEVTRRGEEVNGAEITEYGFGGLGGSFNLDLRASTQRKQLKLGYAVTNRNYRNRLMGTYSTGMSSSGWALSISFSRRWAQEGYVPGTFYDGGAYFASVEKKISDDHSLNFVLLGTPVRRGGQSASIQEMYDLANDHYYNSYWGYQQGEKRSGRIYSGHQPFTILRHDWSISEKLKLTTALGYQFGYSSVEALEWLNTQDPRPDYYRRLPGYQSDPTLADQIRDNLSNNEALRQIQWDRLYEVNLNSVFTVEDANGIFGNNVTGKLSRYVMEERRSEIDKKSGNVVLQWLLDDRNQILVGANVVIQDTRNRKLLADLLGGEFYLDWDKFAEQDTPEDTLDLQNDLLRPNRLVYEGDQFGYDYEAKIHQQSGWVAYRLNARKFEVELAGALKHQTYWRKGYTQNGKFPNNSLGDSEKNDFVLPTGKATLRYKFDGRNYLTVLGMISQAAPTFRNVYVSPRTRDKVVSGIDKENIKSGELRYDYRSPYLRLALSGYYMTTENAIESSSFYHEDLNTFVNLSLTNIDKQFRGVEAAVEYWLLPNRLAVEGAATIGEYIYTDRPLATITQDNSGVIQQQNLAIYARNLYVSGTPQSAYTAGFIYKDPHFWSVFLNINHFAEQWISFNPLRRTAAAVDLVEVNSQQWNDILQQEKSDPGWTLDLSFFKSWEIERPLERYFITVNLGISNLLNNTDYINGGFEQYRFDFETKDINRFPTKYTYMQGLDYFIQAGISF